MSTILLQFGCFGYAKLIEQVYLHHKSRCRKFNIHYHVETELMLGRRPHWEKVRMVADALDNGYDKIVWLDADTIWVNHNLESAFENVEHIGMTWHTEPNYGDHYNNGAMYIRNTDLVHKVVDAWIKEPDTEHVWQDQWGLINVLNKLDMFGIECVQTISHKWNSMVTIPELSDPDPAVLAWHGSPDRAFTELAKYATE